MNSLKVNITSEYGELKSVIINDASSMVSFGHELDVIKNKYASTCEKKGKYRSKSEIWDKAKLQRQVLVFHNVLKEKGVKLIKSKNIKDAWLQVFTRDIGFVVGDTFYIGTMRDRIRSLEQEGMNHLKKSFLKVVKLNVPHIEGGDVFVHNDKVFVGLGQHSTLAAFEELKLHIEKQGFKCYSIKYNPNIMHLDCGFNIINKNKAFLSTDVISKEGVEILEKHFDIIKLTKKELMSLASNYIIISPHEAVVDIRNKRISSILSKEGYVITELEYTELTKLKGSFRCTACPVYREDI